MSEDYDTKRTDLTGPPKGNGGERSAVEDPLIELARIVHKNKQTGTDVSSGRVGSTDYFAALDDFAGEQAPAPRVTDVRSEPVFNQQDDTVHQIASARQPTSTDANMTGEERTVDQEIWPEVPKLETMEQTGSQAFNRPIEPVKPIEPFEVVKTGIAPSVFAEQPTAPAEPRKGLSVDLEDELLGALRQSVDTSANETDEIEAGQSAAAVEASVNTIDDGALREKAPASPASPVSVADFSPVSQFGGYSVRSEPSVSSAISPIPHSGFDQERSVAADDYYAHSPSAAKPATTQPDAPAQDARIDLSDNSIDRKPAERPSIDEDDLFAALNAPQVSEETIESAPDPSGSSSGIDSIFADLDFPDPVQRRQSGPVEQTMREPEPSFVAPALAGDIDDMAWPAAAAAVPAGPEDETPPPPEGYDLDAVARAMQESDPSLTGSGVLPPHPATEKAAAPMAKERSRRGVFVAAAVLGVAALGAAGFFLIDGNAVSIPDGPPPVISGLQEPLKIFPENAPSAGDDQSAKLIYDRVDGTSEGGPDRLVQPETPEPASLPPAPAGTSNGSELVPGAPKRVRTLVVRPDGTIIPDARKIPTPTPGSTDPANSDGSKVVTTTPVTPDVSSEPAVPVISEPVVVQTQPVQGTPAIVNDSAPEASEPVAAQPPAAVPTVLPRSKPAAPVRVAQAPAQVATPAPAATNNDGPLNLAQTAAAPTTPASSNTATGSIAAGTYVVQVTSQRSAAAARDAYSGLQRRFPNILGSRNAVIVSADLGDRGTFFRARIPTGSRDDAVRLCEQLQGAGGDCFVRRAP